MRIGAFLADLPNGARLRLAGLGRRIPPGWSAGDRAPIVLLPGTYETWHLLAPLARALHADGHPIHVIEAIGGNRRPIPWVADQVREAIARRGLRGAVLLAHSKGGIVGKQLLVDEQGMPAPARRIDRLIAIAAPFSGSSMARLVPFGALRAFVPDDALLDRLGAEHAVDERIVSIAPRIDPHIPEGSRLEGAQNIELDLVGHFRILRDPRTLAAVREVAGDA